MGEKRRSTPTHGLISGVVAGVVTSVLCAPLDVAKVRQQVQGGLQLDAKYTGVIATLKSIHANEGIRGLFTGLNIAIINIPLFLGIYWYSYENMKQILSSKYDLPLPALHVVSAMSSACVADCISNPLWVVRTRLQTEYLHRTALSPCLLKNYPTTPVLTVVRNIYAQEGIGAFYKGLTASFLGLPHVAIQFPLYEYFKLELKTHRIKDRDKKPSPLDIVFASTLSKIIAMTLTYPHEVIRIRMQDDRASCISGQKTAAHALSISEVVKGIMRTEGFWSLYSGFRINLLRVIPATVATFLTYEYVNGLLLENS